MQPYSRLRPAGMAPPMAGHFLGRPVSHHSPCGLPPRGRVRRRSAGPTSGIAGDLHDGGSLAGLVNPKRRSRSLDGLLDSVAEETAQLADDAVDSGSAVVCEGYLSERDSSFERLNEDISASAAALSSQDRLKSVSCDADLDLPDNASLNSRRSDSKKRTFIGRCVNKVKAVMRN